MRAERIIVRPFDELKVEQYYGLKQVNEHAYAEFKGQIPFEKKEEYFSLGSKKSWVQIIAITSEGESILLNGITDNIKMVVKNNTCQMELQVYSGSKLMDDVPKKRSFQNKAQTYGEILSVCGEGYDNFAKIMTVGKGETISQFIMQYKETDWQFAKRLASMNNSVLIPDCLTKGEKYYFGLPDRKETVVFGLDEFQWQYDMEEYRKKKETELNLAPYDTITHIWESRDVHELGDWGIIDGQKQVIYKIQSVMQGGELCHTYYLRTENGLKVPRRYNPSIAGVTLFGKVLKVREEQVQIRIDGDMNKEGTGMCWFPYATVYSSQNGSGWYCMPEIADKVRLYFPSEREEEAYVASSCHISGSALRKKPECKFWRNKEGKEIRLEPGEILITNNDGTYIKLSDEDGIEIVSESNITVRSGGTMSMASENESIELNAPKRVLLKQGDTEMRLGGDLNLRGARVKL